MDTRTITITTVAVDAETAQRVGLIAKFGVRHDRMDIEVSTEFVARHAFADNPEMYPFYGKNVYRTTVVGSRETLKGFRSDR